MTKLARFARLGCCAAFYWFAFKTIVQALAISHGWHVHPPEGLRAAEPLSMFADGAIAGLMYWLHRLLLKSTGET